MHLRTVRPKTLTRGQPTHHYHARHTKKVRERMEWPWQLPDKQFYPVMKLLIMRLTTCPTRHDPEADVWGSRRPVPLRLASPRPKPALMYCSVPADCLDAGISNEYIGQ
ncbi:hypothetical protein Pcinc_040153 [Petrolisthes cinctipes]|uniref:Uncharacterized protein n=1 Tax=Petrolisthes cinctipes TaxID=88211 RepID=A0AAE1EL39_PETCI|nr:hypothetical protein Pcinc_040153 [Petrolisthes cinctipes]